MNQLKPPERKKWKKQFSSSSSSAALPAAAAAAPAELTLVDHDSVRSLGSSATTPTSISGSAIVEDDLEAEEDVNIESDATVAAMNSSLPLPLPTRAFGSGIRHRVKLTLENAGVRIRYT